MACHVVSVTSFFLLICMHFSNARLLLPASSAIVNPDSSTANSISDLQVSEKRTQINSPVTQSPNGEHGQLNAQDIEKIDHRVFKEGSEIVESSSSLHVALLKGKHFKDTNLSSLPQHFEKEEVTDPGNNDVVLTDYQLPQRKTPIHNK